jgi:hypothetical protein
VARRARILVATGLAIAVLVGGVVAWFDRADWKALLLFGSMVGVAAWGWARRPVQVEHGVNVATGNADAPVSKGPAG